MKDINTMTPETQVSSKERCILRMPEVEKRTGYKRAHIYNLMKEGRFP